MICNIDELASLKYERVYCDHTMYRMTLTFDVCMRVKVTTHRLNEDNMCTKLDGN